MTKSGGLRLAHKTNIDLKAKKMKAIITYKKGDNEGGLLAFEDGTFEAFTVYEYRKFKTEKGAAKWLNSKGYFVA